MVCIRHRVLVADDDGIVLFLWRQVLLRPVGAYDTVTVAGGCEALAELARVPFDLVVTDIIMPGIGGVELTEAIRRLGCKTPVIWFTGQGVPNMGEEAERLGVYCCLYKPLEVHEMRQAVADALADSQKEPIP